MKSENQEAKQGETVAEILARDPLEWSQGDLASLVVFLRKARTMFAEKVSKAATTGSRIRTTKPKLDLSHLPEVDLD